MSRAAELFAIAAFALLGLMFLSPLFSSPQDLVVSLRGTGFAFRPEIVFLGMAAVLTLWALAYALPLPMNSHAGLWHFWLTALSLLCFWSSFYFMGFLGRPGESLGPMTWTLILFTLSGLVFALTQGIFLISFGFAVNRFFRGVWG